MHLVSSCRETAIPVEIARQRELKWLEMFSNWDKWLLRRFQKVKLRCRKGIPSSLRAKAWQFLCNGHELLTKNPGKFEVSGHHNDVVEVKDGISSVDVGT
ncbi:hypothetical protein GDO78_022705 [Eleutherodactylus coqui]|uniref:Uncharacterized protein n=1 Tax=Eleutherodactylus coqui TaxID=57060 RepID=A0A8J6EGD5_ELECQ|nr:hypothetical protein GDO78_022705 [Eleutherodactylus coqui]